MPLPLTNDARDKINAREIASAWFLDLYCDENVLHCWDQQHEIQEGGITYEPLGDQWRVEGEINSGAELVPEPIVIIFDGASKLDNTSFIGRLLDNTWHQRKVRLRQFVFTPMSGHRLGAAMTMEWNGTMQTMSDAEGGDGASEIVLNCESGTFKALARNMQTITDVNQRERDPDDGSFSNMATKQKERIPFGIGWHAVPGTRVVQTNGGGGGTTNGHPRWGGIGG